MTKWWRAFLGGNSCKYDAEYLHQPWNRYRKQNHFSQHLNGVVNRFLLCNACCALALRQLHMFHTYASSTEVKYASTLFLCTWDKYVSVFSVMHVTVWWWWLRRRMFNLNAWERERFFPLGTLCLSSSPPAPLDGRASSKNLISSKSKFQEFEHIHHKFCLSCGFFVWVASASIGQTKYTRTQISFHSQMMFLMWYFIQSCEFHWNLISLLRYLYISWRVGLFDVFQRDWTWQSPPTPLLVAGEIGITRTARWSGVESWDIYDFEIRSNLIWFNLNSDLWRDWYNKVVQMVRTWPEI